ncbi:MAG TPA: tetratricopeptide repeat protein [Terracidiphilus sp.]|nr:tetratricopeptide repeat protein [Terracidiphilus sp.]
MDTQTRHALKKDKFAQATASSVSWVGEHRSGVLRWAIAAVVVLALGIGAVVYWNLRTTAADSALGAAMDTYDGPLATPGAPAENGVYTTAAERSRAANKQFAAVAQQYGWLPEGAKAHYFAGITDQELGQTAAAETELKTAAGAWDHNLSNLAKLALAGIYHQTGRDGQAVDIYNQLIAKPSVTVSASVAQLDLADLYAAAGKQDQARALWAKVKDADKDGQAGTIATQRLAGK